MTSLVRLREQGNLLVERLLSARAAVEAIRSQELVVAPEMAAIHAEIHGDVDEPEFYTYEALRAGDALPLFGKTALQILHGRRDGHYPIADAFASLTTLVCVDLPLETDPYEPDLTLLSDRERLSVLEYHADRIVTLFNRLRLCHVRLETILAVHAPLPAHLVDRCIGLFGAPDWPTNFRYRPEHFFDPKKPYAGRNGHGSFLPIWSRDYLAPLIGEVRAVEIEAAFGIARAYLRPRPSEPEIETAGTPLGYAPAMPSIPEIDALPPTQKPPSARSLGEHLGDHRYWYYGRR